MPSVITDIFSVYLIERYRIPVRAVALRVGSRQILVGIGMAVNAPYCRMGKACIYGDVASKRLENVQDLGEFEIFFPAMRKPAPILPSRVFPEGDPYSIRVVYAYESPRSLARGSTFGAKGFEPRQCESKAGTTQEGSTFQRVCFVVHIHLTLLFKNKPRRDYFELKIPLWVTK
jgi:hypothetical protein